MWLCFTWSWWWAKSMFPPCTEAQLTWGNLLNCDCSALAQSIPWSPKWGKQGTNHDRYRMQQPPGQSSPVRDLVLKSSMKSASSSLWGSSAWLQLAHPPSPLHWSKWLMDRGYHLRLPDTRTEQEPDLPAARFGPGSEHESKSTAQVSFPVCVIWQVCSWS